MIKKQKGCVKPIHSITVHDLYGRKAFPEKKYYFDLSSLNDGEFINHEITLKKQLIRWVPTTISMIQRNTSIN